MQSRAVARDNRAVISSNLRLAEHSVAESTYEHLSMCWTNFLHTTG
ncbi:hypothetical protein [Botrimarina colliarenosi]|nr:hypothetical protein [Botrimarina colliarenosi]